MLVADTGSSLRATVILGAGFSKAAGLPLTRELFEIDTPPLSVSKRATSRFHEVREAWTRWKREHDGDGEAWLADLYRCGTSAMETHGTTWEAALQVALSRLIVTTKRAKKVPFFHGVTSPNRNAAHQQFWMEVRRAFDVQAIVTMNYDLLAEQALKEVDDSKRRAPVCYYGGHPVPQFVQKMVRLTAKTEAEKYKPVQLGSALPIFKMHGSINWAFECGDFTIHEDVRAAFRTDARKGDVAIVPPIPEKDMLPWQYLVWRMAAERLRDSDVWIVCGYSLPDYDKALRKFFKDAAAAGPPNRVYVMDPAAASVAARWRAVVPAKTDVVERQGIPGVFATKWI
jgi:hypothetical protein